MKPNIQPHQPTRLLDGAPYHDAASHQTSEGLRERFARINPDWNKKPTATVHAIRRNHTTQEK